ncbi:MAG TPA: hypothetical protein VJI33_00505 [Candidatus Paceibacterota bacterium]
MERAPKKSTLKVNSLWEEKYRRIEERKDSPNSRSIGATASDSRDKWTSTANPFSKREQWTRSTSLVNITP